MEVADFRCMSTHHDSDPRGRELLAISSFSLFPVADGATLRVTELLRELSNAWSIQLVSPTHSEYLEDVSRLGVRTHRHVPLAAGWTYWPWQYDTTTFEKEVAEQIAAQEPSVALAWTGSEFLADRVPHFPPFVADRIDCATRMAWNARREATDWRKRIRWLDNLRLARRYERSVARLPYSTVVVGEDDARWLRRASGVRNVATIPNGVRVSPSATVSGEALVPTVVFSGVMAYSPNVHAVSHFANAIWPHVRKRRPEARFEIVGRRPSPEVHALARLPGIHVLGEVEDLRSIVGRAWVAVAPMRSGTGIKNKVLEAWAVGTPVVMSSLATNGLGRIDEFRDLVVDEPLGMAERIVQLLDDSEERSRLQDLALGAAQERSWKSAADAMSRLLDGAGQPR